MEDELDQEGMEEGVEEPQKAKGGGGLIKKVVILGVLLLAAFYLVFINGTTSTMFGFGDKEIDLEPQTQQQSNEGEEIPWGFEYTSDYLTDITHSMWDDEGRRIKSVVVDVTFVTSKGTANFLEAERKGQVLDVIHSAINEFAFSELIKQVYKDSLGKRIQFELNRRLPPDMMKKEENRIMHVLLNIITM